MNDYNLEDQIIAAQPETESTTTPFTRKVMDSIKHDATFSRAVRTISSKDNLNRRTRFMNKLVLSKKIMALAVVLILASALIAGYALQQNKKTEVDKTGQTQKTSPKAKPTPGATLPVPMPPAPAINYAVIEEWGVKLPISGTLSNIKFAVPKTTGYSETDQSVSIVTPELDKSWTCATDDNQTLGTIGKISRTSQAKRDGPYEPAATKKIGTYTYGFEPGGSNCTTDLLYYQLVEEFKRAFNSLTAN